MRQPADELLIVLSHGLAGWMTGDTTDAIEISIFATTTRHPLVPHSPADVEPLLQDLEERGLVERQASPQAIAREVFIGYRLTEAGWARAGELESERPWT